MGLRSWLKRNSSPEPIDTTFTAEEAKIAPDIAQTAGAFMSLQLSTASRYAMALGHELKGFMWQVQAFAFGLLCSALDEKGIPWYKGAPVLVQYCERYMPDYTDHKELAQLVSHFGTNSEYEPFVASGRAAMVRFANTRIENPTSADANDLAIALGLDRDSE